MQTELLQLKLKRYLHEAVGIVIHPIPWDGATRLPFFLREHYTFFKVELLDVRCLIMLDRANREEPPAIVRKHMDQVKVKWGGEIIYERERVTAYNRKRLIEHKLPFVVPGNQLYLPFLGIDLREHFKKLRVETIKFSPSTQMLVIYILLHGSTEKKVTPVEMARLLSYSAMTMTRAFDELESTGLGEIIPEGRERLLSFQGSAKDIWAKAQPFLRSPVKERICLGSPNFKPPWPLAGLSALACYSILNGPSNPVFALSRKDWKSLIQRRQVNLIPAREPGAIEIEVWNYTPSLLAKDDLVDRLSLYLSLKESKDERIEAALEEMMKGQQW